MKKLMKRFRYYGEKGFTLIELLIVVAVLGILAAVIVPNLATFIGTGQAAAANTEVAMLETAALAYYADNSEWPPNGEEDLVSGNYTSGAPEYDGYTFPDSSFGKVSVSDGTAWPNDSSVTWDDGNHKWSK